MKICFPVGNADGSYNLNNDPRKLESFLRKLRGEPLGQWLVATNGQWHSGIHLSDKSSAPYAKLIPELINSHQVTPLCAMAEGEVIAYRLSTKYLDYDYYRDEDFLKYSNSFVLIRSHYQTDEQETLLTFYTLYMHIAPICDYPKGQRYAVSARHSVLIHPFVENASGQYGMPDNLYVRSQGNSFDIPPHHGLLKGGEEFTVEQTAYFFWHDTVNQRYQRLQFGLAQRYPHQGERFWISLNPEYLETKGDSYQLMPAWMQQAVGQGKVDSVQTLAETEVIKVAAGEAIGHLSHFIEPDVPPNTEEYYYTHLEVFTDDSRLADFIHNKKGLTGGQEYVKCTVDQPIYDPDFTHPDVFRPMPEAKTEKEFLLPVEEATPRKDYQGNMWYQIDTGEWVKADGNGVKIVSQHQLDELGFTLIDEVDNDNDAHATFSGKGANMLALMNQLWEEAKLDRLFSRWQMKHDYEQMIKLMKIEQDRFDYKETAFALRKAINNPPMQHIVNKAIIRHQSEWVEDSKSPYWKLFFKAVGSLTDNEYLQQFLDNHIWMKEVPQFSQGQKLWYMHPLVFLNILADDDNDEMNLKWLKVPKGQLTFDAEGDDNEHSVYFSRTPSVPNNHGLVIGASGVTFGRGLDLGQQTKNHVKDLFYKMAEHARPLSSKMYNWLVNGIGIQKKAALDYCKSIDSDVPKNEQELTRKQQHFLFNAMYSTYESTTRRVLSHGVKVNNTIISVYFDDLSSKTKEVLVDIVYRGDATMKTKEIIFPTLVENNGKENENAFYKVMSDNIWTEKFNVPSDRFNKRKDYLK